MNELYPLQSPAIPEAPDVLSVIDIDESSSRAQLRSRFDVTPEDVRNKIRPIFFWMFDQGIESITISRAGAKVVVSIDGHPVMDPP